mgnify:CR=1 FL=1
MYLNYNSNDTFVSTGGKNIELNKPTICFVHGAGQNHFSFTQQIRYFANRGYNVLSPDFPGHGFSKGQCNSSIEDDTIWLSELLQEIGINEFVIAGHSQGCLTAIEFNKLSFKSYLIKAESLVQLFISNTGTKPKFLTGCVPVAAMSLNS